MTDIRTAFRQAVASATAGGAAEVEVDTRRRALDVDADDDDTPADDDDDSAPDEDAEDAEEADEAAEDADEDADEGEDEGEDESGDEDAESDEGEESEDAEAETSDRHALNDEKEFKRVQDKYKNDPIGLRKELLGTFTKKTQEIASERKTYKGLLSYLPLVEAYEANPERTIKQLARMNGLRVVDADGDETPAPKSKKDADDTSTDLAGDLMAEFKKELGADNEYLADAIGPALTKLLTRVSEKTVGARVKSLEEATTQALRGNAEIESDRVMESFYTKHADWKDYEEDMNALIDQLVDPDNPRVPMGEAQFLEFLYKTAKNNKAASERPRKEDEEQRRVLKKRLKKISTARNGDRRPVAPPSEDKIRRRPKGPVSIRQAFKAAAAGITFDDSDDDDE